MNRASLLPASPDAPVTAESLSAHIISEIDRTAGPQLPCYQREAILNGFFDRFGGEDGMAVSNQAFKVHEGMWRGAPVTVLRFQAGHDEFFARPLLEEVRAAS